MAEMKIPMPLTNSDLGSDIDPCAQAMMVVAAARAKNIWLLCIGTSIAERN